MGSIFRRDGAWVVKWKDGRGRWLQRRTSCATKLEAQGLARELERKAEFQRLGVEPIEAPTAMTFAELLGWYWSEFGAQLRSQSARFSEAKHLRPSLGHLQLSEVTAARIDSALCERAGELSPKSLNTLRGFVQTVFNKAIQRELWKGTNPAEAVPRRRVAKRPPSYLKPDEVTQVLPFVLERYRALFATAVYTGMRKGELAALRKADVDLDAGVLTVGRSWQVNTTKGGHADLLPIHPELKPYLVDAIRKSKSALVFPRSDGSMQRESIDLPSLLRSALARAGLVDGWTHKCRRRGCGYSEEAETDAVRKCPKCNFTLWPSAKKRRTRFHDLRHYAEPRIMPSRPVRSSGSAGKSWTSDVADSA